MGSQNWLRSCTCWLHMKSLLTLICFSFTIVKTFERFWTHEFLTFHDSKAKFSLTRAMSYADEWVLSIRCTCMQHLNAVKQCRKPWTTPFCIYSRAEIHLPQFFFNLDLPKSLVKHPLGRLEFHRFESHQPSWNWTWLLLLPSLSSPRRVSHAKRQAQAVLHHKAEIRHVSAASRKLWVALNSVNFLDWEPVARLCHRPGAILRVEWISKVRTQVRGRKVCLLKEESNL